MLILLSSSRASFSINSNKKEMNMKYIKRFNPLISYGRAKAEVEQQGQDWVLFTSEYGHQAKYKAALVLEWIDSQRRVAA